jgi:hypothetical protein
LTNNSIDKSLNFCHSGVYWELIIFFTSGTPFVSHKTTHKKGTQLRGIKTKVPQDNLTRREHYTCIMSEQANQPTESLDKQPEEKHEEKESLTEVKPYAPELINPDDAIEPTVVEQPTQWYCYHH